MRRRTLLGGLTTIFTGIFTPRAANAADKNEYERRADEYMAKALANFPGELIETTGKDAFEKWRGLKTAGRGTPVILGGDESTYSNLFDPFGDNGPHVPLPPSVESILAAAAKIHFPDDLVKKQTLDEAAARKSLLERYAKDPDGVMPTITEVDAAGNRHILSKEETWQRILAQPQEPGLGEWPARIDTSQDVSPGLSVVTDYKGNFLSKVHIAVFPTDDWTTIPAYLRFGGWNACPAAEYHVAAMRSWRDRYGAELVGVAFDTLNLTVQRRPQNRDEALALAHEQYAYCNDIIEQGTQTFSSLAAALMASDWYFFWWD